MKRKRKNSEFSRIGFWLRGGDELVSRGYIQRGRYFVPIFERQNANQITLQLITIILLGVSLPVWLPVLVVAALLGKLE